MRLSLDSLHFDIQDIHTYEWQMMIEVIEVYIVSMTSIRMHREGEGGWDNLKSHHISDGTDA